MLKRLALLAAVTVGALVIPDTANADHRSRRYRGNYHRYYGGYGYGYSRPYYYDRYYYGPSYRSSYYYSPYGYYNSYPYYDSYYYGYRRPSFGIRIGW